MRKRHHFFIINRVDKKGKLRDLLNLSRIAYKRTEDLLSFEIYEDNPNFTEIKRTYDKIDGTEEQVFLDFSEEELDSADYLEIWIYAYSGYPQPENSDRYDKSFEDYTYDKGAYCKVCGCGLVQNNPFYVKKSFNPARKKVCGLYWIYDTLFISNEVKEALLKTDLQGYMIRPAYAIQTKKPRDDVFQLEFREVFPLNLSFDVDEVKDCPVCGSHKSIMKKCTFCVADKKMKEPCTADFYLSRELFGDGTLCCRKMLVSSRTWRFFKTLKVKNIVARPLLFE